MSDLAPAVDHACNPAEVAQLLNITVDTVRRLIRTKQSPFDGSVPVAKVGGQYRVSQRLLLAFLEAA